MTTSEWAGLVVSITAVVAPVTSVAGSAAVAAAKSAASRAPLSAAPSAHTLTVPPFLSEGRVMAATPSVIAAHARAL
jgi:hypothetical protein